jgi:hypothetical protein
MTTFSSNLGDQASLLRRALWIDAGISFGAAIAAIVAAGPIEALTGIPAAILPPVGVSFLVFVAGVSFVASRPTINRRHVQVIMALNFLYVPLCFAALIFGWLSLTPLGAWIFPAQALMVGLFGVGQWLGLRRLG